MSYLGNHWTDLDEFFLLFLSHVDLSNEHRLENIGASFENSLWSLIRSKGITLCSSINCNLIHVARCSVATSLPIVQTFIQLLTASPSCLVCGDCVDLSPVAVLEE